MTSPSPITGRRPSLGLRSDDAVAQTVSSSHLNERAHTSPDKAAKKRSASWGKKDAPKDLIQQLAVSDGKEKEKDSKSRQPQSPKASKDIVSPRKDRDEKSDKSEKSEKSGRDEIATGRSNSNSRPGSVGRREGKDLIAHSHGGGSLSTGGSTATGTHESMSDKETARLLAATDYETESLGAPRPDYSNTDTLQFSAARTLRGGTLAQLFDWLVENCYEPRHPSTQAFVAAYRQWAPAKELFKLVYDKYTGDATRPGAAIVPTRKKVIAFVLAWLDGWLLRDFAEPRAWLLPRLLDLINTFRDTGFPQAAYRCKLLLVRHRAAITARQAARRARTARQAKEKGGKGHLDVLQTDAQVLAEQLTLIEAQMFGVISASELLNLTWKNARKRGSHVNALVRRFNIISYWVATEVVMPRDVRTRVELIVRFIAVARRCLDMGNFNTTMELLAGLNHVSVTRLKRTWAELPARAQQQLAELNALMDTQHNYKPYRELLAARRLPALPYLGIYLRDLVFIEEGNPDLLPPHDGARPALINFEKLMMLAQTLAQLARYQSVRYAFPVLPDAHKYLTRLTQLPDEVLYIQSTQAEPRDPNVPRAD